ncbi:hypothetical protein EJB05_25268, partial [Eragrostis curvula]
MGKRRAASQAAIPSSRDAKIARARDWAGLEDGPAGLVAERVLTDDVGYVRFRAVCRAWRRCCDDPRTRGGGVLDDPRLRPRHRQWIMLLGQGEKLTPAAAPHRCRRQFLNVSTGQCIQVVDVPELRDHGVIPSTAAEGLLILFCKATGAIRLLNPLTRQAAELPPVTSLRKFEPGYSTSGLADDRTVLLNSCGEMAFAKPGDERWVLLVDNNDTHLLMANVFFAGRFYGIYDHTIVTVDMDRSRDLPPRLVVVAKLKFTLLHGNGMEEKTAHLVDNGGGQLMLVHRKIRIPARDKMMYKVYRVDLEAGTVTTRGGSGGGLSLGGRAVFIGRCRALSVSPRVFPSIEANAIYPGLCFNERGGTQQVGVYRIRDGSTKSFGYHNGSTLRRPWSIADCLAVYVSG